ncbi:MAG: hypothetical protein Q8S02_15200 [Hydrogenophaga sp.]|nr:hypothetical protein [Hydrogenophaga sp.]
MYLGITTYYEKFGDRLTPEQVKWLVNFGLMPLLDEKLGEAAAANQRVDLNDSVEQLHLDFQRQRQESWDREAAAAKAAT